MSANEQSVEAPAERRQKKGAAKRKSSKSKPPKSEDSSATVTNHAEAVPGSAAAETGHKRDKKRKRAVSQAIGTNSGDVVADAPAVTDSVVAGARVKRSKSAKKASYQPDVAAGNEAEQNPKRKSKSKAKAQLLVDTPADRGPGNLQEAEQIRQRLGIKASDPTSASTALGFTFNFSDIPEQQPPPSDDSEDAAEPAAGAEAKRDVDGEHDVEAQAAHAGDAAAAHAPVDASETQPRPESSPDARKATSKPHQGIVDEDGYVQRRVYIGGMPFWYTEDQIRECWETCGAIEGLTMLTFPDSGNFRGIVFVTFATEEGYEAALGYNGDELDGKTLVVKRCLAPPSALPQRTHDNNGRRGCAEGQVKPGHSHRHNARGSAGQTTPPKEGPAKVFDAPPKRVKGYHVAFVGNIPWELNKAAIEDMFSSFQPTMVRMFDDPSTGKHKGFAHLHFKNAQAVDKSISLDGTSVFGRKLKVMYAQPSRKGRPSKTSAADEGASAEAPRKTKATHHKKRRKTS